VRHNFIITAYSVELVLLNKHQVMVAHLNYTDTRTSSTE